jgi:hypothetical protein
VQQKCYKQTDRQTAGADCKQFDETISMLVLAKEQYIKIHDRVCAEQHCNAYKEMGVKSDNEQWCDLVHYGQ